MQSSLNIFDWHIVKQLIKCGGYGWVNIVRKFSF